MRGIWKPLGLNKAVLSRESLPPRMATTVHCPHCGWQGAYAETKIALWIDLKIQTPVTMGGDGRNYRCPKCGDMLAATRGVNAELI